MLLLCVVAHCADRAISLNPEPLVSGRKSCRICLVICTKYRHKHADPTIPS